MQTHLENIVIVSNDPINHFLLQNILKTVGYTGSIETHTNPNRALELLARTTKSRTLVIADVHMSPINGFKFAENFSELPEETLEKCELILQTSHRSQRDDAAAKDIPVIKKIIDRLITHEAVKDLLDAA